MSQEHDCKFRRLVEGIERNTKPHPTDDFRGLEWKMGVIHQLCRKALGLQKEVKRADTD